jgi:hypothetical protein
VFIHWGAFGTLVFALYSPSLRATGVEFREHGLVVNASKFLPWSRISNWSRGEDKLFFWYQLRLFGLVISNYIGVVAAGEERVAVMALLEANIDKTTGQ